MAKKRGKTVKSKKVKFSKKWFYAIIVVGILSLGIFSVNAALHSSNDFLIKIGTDVGTLQHAINGNYFTQTHTYSSPSALNPGHTANEIWVSVKDGEMNLIQALSSANKLCPASPLKTSYSGPTDKSKAYHYASEIGISSGKSFQQAIDDGNFCCVPDCSCAATTCVGTTCTDPVCGQTCDGTKLRDTCASLGYECDPWSDGCGGTLSCGTCGSGYTCSAGKCVIIVTYTYSWYTGNWSSWSSSDPCDGTSTTTVYCERDDGTQVGDSYCSGTKPVAKKCRICDYWYTGKKDCKLLVSRRCADYACDICSNLGSSFTCRTGGSCGFLNLGRKTNRLECQSVIIGQGRWSCGHTCT